MAITQIVIYVGGILVLILFAFMLSGRETLEAAQQQKSRLLTLGKIPGLLLAVLFFAVMAVVLYNSGADSLPWVQQSVSGDNILTPADTTVNNIGVNLMTTYLLPFEAISILLLVALVGAAHLSRKEQVV